MIEHVRQHEQDLYDRMMQADDVKNKAQDEWFRAKCLLEKCEAELNGDDDES